MIEDNIQNRVLKIIAEFLCVTADNLFPETNLRGEFDLGSNEICQLMSIDLSDGLDIEIRYYVSDINTVQDIVDIIANEYQEGGVEADCQMNLTMGFSQEI